MEVKIQWCNDTKTFQNGYAFWCNGKVVARCDESDYHETINELVSKGYIVK